MAEEEKKEFNNDNEAGAIWIHEDKQGNPMLRIGLDGKDYTGFKNVDKTNEKAPDYNIVQYVDGKPNQVGVAWSGKTKNDNQKLNIKMDAGETSIYLTAVMRNNENIDEKSNRADMTIFKPSGAEEIAVASQAAEADAAAVDAPVVKAKPKAL